jgi:RNA polymerase sigma-70 factor (ECF subfamily)
VSAVALAHAASPSPVGDIVRRAAQSLIGYRRVEDGAKSGVAYSAETGRAGLDQFAGSRDADRIRADQTAMAAIAAGDRAAFSRLVGQLTPGLLRFARGMLAGNPADAEEVVQEALIRLWQQAATWRPAGRISTWLHQVVYRLAIDHIRRQRPSVDLDAVGPELADEAPSPGRRMALREDARTVQAAVAALPVRQRTAIVLCHYQGLSQSEAAGIMGIVEDAYESLLARGRRALRAALAGTEEGA